jgi:phosphoribosylanthranilate isomerase
MRRLFKPSFPVSHTRIKICGITRPEDALIAVANGADAIGLVFYAGSPRSVAADIAAEIAQAVPPFVTVVALFVDELAEEIERILNLVSVDMIQFHGNEPAAFCGQFHRPWIKALRVRPGMDIEAACEEFSGARGVLLDSWQAGVPGGTGETFDWRLAPDQLRLPVVLAGGLHPGNVADAVCQVRPAAVDVSSGVERSPGIKDAEKIRQFIAAVRAAEQLRDETSHDD